MANGWVASRKCRAKGKDEWESRGGKHCDTCNTIFHRFRVKFYGNYTHFRSQLWQSTKRLHFIRRVAWQIAGMWPTQSNEWTTGNGRSTLTWHTHTNTISNLACTDFCSIRTVECDGEMAFAGCGTMHGKQFLVDLSFTLTMQLCVCLLVWHSFAALFFSALVLSTIRCS